MSIREADIAAASTGAANAGLWRAEVFGNDAKALREGRLAIALVNGEAAVIENPHFGERKPSRRKSAVEAI